MPLPWLMIFLFIFFCLFSVSLYFTFLSFDSTTPNKNFKSYSEALSW